jgi:hypothetical protein
MALPGRKGSRTGRRNSNSTSWSTSTNFLISTIPERLAPINPLVGNPTALKLKQVINSVGLSLIKGLQNACKNRVDNAGMAHHVAACERPLEVVSAIIGSTGCPGRQTAALLASRLAASSLRPRRPATRTVPRAIRHRDSTSSKKSDKALARCRLCKAARVARHSLWALS